MRTLNGTEVNGMISREEAYAITKEAYKQCIRQMPVSECWLYGSYARGDFTDDSDVDILMTVDLPSEQLRKFRTATAQISSRISLQYGITVSITLKSTEDFSRYSTFVPYYKNVLQEGWRYAG